MLLTVVVCLLLAVVVTLLMKPVYQSDSVIVVKFGREFIYRSEVGEVSNQAIPTLLFGRDRAAFTAAFPALSLVSVEQLAGPSYPASGGFSRGALLPAPLWSALHRFEARLPATVMRWLAFRMLIVVSKT